MHSRPVMFPDSGCDITWVTCHITHNVLTLKFEPKTWTWKNFKTTQNVIAQLMMSVNLYLFLDMDVHLLAIYWVLQQNNQWRRIEATKILISCINIMQLYAIYLYHLIPKNIFTVCIFWICEISNTKLFLVNPTRHNLMNIK